MCPMKSDVREENGAKQKGKKKAKNFDMALSNGVIEKGFKEVLRS